MSNLFFPIRVSDVIRETTDASTIVLDIPEHLKSNFNYQAGQYLTLSLTLNGQEARRAYSFSSSPYADDKPAITVKKVADGLVSPYINEGLKPGDTLQIMPPMGKFTLMPDATKSAHYLLFGGGSGITPIMSILKTVLLKEPNSKVSLVYANRNEASIIFQKQLNQLKEENSDRLTIYHSLEEAGSIPTFFNGRPSVQEYQRITQEIQQESAVDSFYICGPVGMMDAVKSALLGLGSASEKIHTEYFTSPTNQNISKPVVEEEVPFTGTAEATILFGGQTFEIQIPKGVTVLEAAKDQNVDPPYACQMGVCTTCRAKMLEGKVEMDEREGLSDSEIEEGYVLTCQSHPKTAKIKLIYE